MRSKRCKELLIPASVLHLSTHRKGFKVVMKRNADRLMASCIHIRNKTYPCQVVRTKQRDSVKVYRQKPCLKISYCKIVNVTGNNGPAPPHLTVLLCCFIPHWLQKLIHLNGVCIYVNDNSDVKELLFLLL